jgi:polysaccharide export outer membrane protein
MSTPASLPKAFVPAFVKFLALPLVVFLLNGCAFAPGMYFADAAQNGTSGFGSCARPETPPPGALTDITAELIQHQRETQAIVVGADIKRLFGVAKPYRIGPGDILNVVVWDHPELNLIPATSITSTVAGSSSGIDAASLALIGNGYPVSADGMIQFPYAGNVEVEGLTDFEARDLLVSRLSKYLKNPQVTVRLQAYLSGRVYVDGAVARPGLQAITDVPATLPDIIGRAGGFTAAADQSTVAVSRNGNTTVINLPQLTALGINPADILLRSGDLVRVPNREESLVYVMGEVLRPTAQPLINGRLTLNQALGAAAGINPSSANPKQIYVVRSTRGTQPEIYHLDASSPAAYALAEGFELKSHDVVYVDPVPLVRWNRVISLILPSASAITSASTVSNNLKP